MSRHSLQSRVWVMQIVTIAVLIGGVAIVTIFYALGANGQGPNDLPLLSYIAAGLLAMQSAAAMIVPRTMVNVALPRLASQPPGQDEDRLFNLRQTTHIIAVALLESAVLFAAIAFYIERQEWALLLAIAGIISIALRFPTKADVESWIELHERRLAELRSNAPRPAAM